MGVNTSERYLKLLAEHTFLSLWSYLGIYRDQKWSGGCRGDANDLTVAEGVDKLMLSENDSTSTS